MASVGSADLLRARDSGDRHRAHAACPSKVHAPRRGRPCPRGSRRTLRPTALLMFAQEQPPLDGTGIGLQVRRVRRLLLQPHAP
jgi:hypothetical protein